MLDVSTYNQNNRFTSLRNSIIYFNMKLGIRIQSIKLICNESNKNINKEHNYTYNLNVFHSKYIDPLSCFVISDADFLGVIPIRSITEINNTTIIQMGIGIIENHVAKVQLS